MIWLENEYFYHWNGVSEIQFLPDIDLPCPNDAAAGHQDVAGRRW